MSGEAFGKLDSPLRKSFGVLKWAIGYVVGVSHNGDAERTTRKGSANDAKAGTDRENRGKQDTCHIVSIGS